MITGAAALITIISKALIGTIQSLPKSGGKRVKMAVPFNEVVEQSLKSTVSMLTEKPDEGMTPGEKRMLAFNLAQVAGFADAVGDTMRGYDDDEVQP